MVNALFISYGGYAKNGYKYTPYKAIAYSAEEAVAVINTWKSYGRKNSTAQADCIVVNEVAEKKIRTLFADGLGTYPNGKSRACVCVRTTGCGAWNICLTYALADTLQEHERIYNERLKEQEAARKEREHEIQQARMAELYVRRRGWYYVELTFTAYVFAQHGNDYLTDLTFSGDIIAESGADAYRKAVKEVEDNPTMYHWGTVMVQSIPDAWSDDFSFTFLGVKTDEGYSVEKWEEMKENLK